MYLSPFATRVEELASVSLRNTMDSATEVWAMPIVGLLEHRHRAPFVPVGQLERFGRASFPADGSTTDFRELSEQVLGQVLTYDHPPWG
jgi:hypothetical protein